MTRKHTLRFGGRVAIVTGAMRGLGRAYALELAQRGASVVVNDPGVNLRGDDMGEPEPADAVVREIVDAGGIAKSSYHDIAKPDQAQGLVDLAVSAFDGLRQRIARAASRAPRISAES